MRRFRGLGAVASARPRQRRPERAQGKEQGAHGEETAVRRALEGEGAVDSGGDGGAHAAGHLERCREDGDAVQVELARQGAEREGLDGPNSQRGAHDGGDVAQGDDPQGVAARGPRGDRREHGHECHARGPRASNMDPAMGPKITAMTIAGKSTSEAWRPLAPWTDCRWRGTRMLIAKTLMSTPAAKGKTRRSMSGPGRTRSRNTKATSAPMPTTIAAAATSRSGPNTVDTP